MKSSPKIKFKLRIKASTLFVFIAFSGFQTLEAKCNRKSQAAADYTCKIKNSQKSVDIKYRYKKSQISSASFEYLQEESLPYAQDFFYVKTAYENKIQNCILFGLFGRCERKKIDFCGSSLSVSHSETHGLFSGYKYKRKLLFDLKNKKGSYTYLRKTPKASAEHKLKSYKVDFENCKLTKKF